jgi:hypothetical protein
LQLAASKKQAASSTFTLVHSSSTMSIKGMKQFARPTDLGLMLLAAHYFRKYNLDIVVTGDAESFEHAMQKPSGFCTKDSPRAWGIIAVEKGKLSHATPVICYKETAESVIQYIILDSTNQVNPYVSKYFQDMKHTHGTPQRVYQNIGKRQRDNIGCRTDALCILKDALKLLNTKEFTNLESLLSPVSEPEEYLTHAKKFDLPSCWAKTVQDLDMIDTKVNQQALIIRAKEAPETLKDFRTRYTLIEASRILKYTMTAVSKENGSLSKTIIMHSLDKPQCAYLNYKGKRNFFKIKTILENKDRLLIARFERLQSFFELGW